MQGMVHPGDGVAAAAAAERSSAAVTVHKETLMADDERG